MLLRWVSAAVQEASGGFRRVRGYRDLAELVQTLQSIENQEKEATITQVA